MKLPYSWLAQLVDGLPDPETTGETLTMLGFEVEEIVSPGAEINDVVVAKLLETEPHPDADKLTLCKVNDGETVHHIVCGARNMKAGDCVALARVGTVLPGDFKIEKRKIRGQTSKGMLCSTRELGLGDDHDGIMILPGDAPVGERLVDYLNLNEAIFDLGITPNRSDALSAVGLAREAAAAFDKPLAMPETAAMPADSEPDYAPRVDLDDETLCPRYTALVIKNVKIGPSPDWLKTRLEACGVRSINTVVDATNLVLLELGQPLHAFDLKKLAEGRIVVRRAKAGETIKTIDDETRTLSDDMLVIADAKAPVAVAGVMGGADSEVSDDTTDILLESAYFHPPSVRKTSKALGLSSEASYRFERGVDFETVIPAAWRCARLIAELAGGTIAGEMTVADAEDDSLIEPLRERSLALSLDYCDRLLGKALDRDEIESIFNRLNLTVSERSDTEITVRIPSYRKDIQRQADLIEELARCHGYNSFEPVMPLAPLKAPERQPIARDLVRRIRDYLNCNGLDEALTYSFTDARALKPFPNGGVNEEAPACAILNPINSQEGVMRSSMLPSLLQSAQRNAAHGNADFGLFELARVYRPGGDRVDEARTLAGVIVGSPARDWRNGKREFDFFDLKGLLQGLLGLAGLSRFRTLDGPECLHPHRGVAIQAGKTPFGYYGELHPAIADDYGLQGRVCVFEMELEPLGRAYDKSLPQFKPYSAFPAIRRDLAFLLPDGVSAETIEKTVRKHGGGHLEDVALFDYYRGKQVAEGCSSVAFRLTFRSSEGTLKDDDVDAACQSILNTLQSECNVRLRS